MSKFARAVLPLAALLLIGGCNEYGYHYRAANQSPLDPAPIFADYQRQGNDVKILVDTQSRKLQSIAIVKPDGTTVAPQRVDYPTFEPQPITGGGGTSYAVDVPTGPTIAEFDRRNIGARPWKVQINLLGMHPVVVDINAPSAPQ